MARSSPYCLGAGYSQNRSSIHQTFTYFIGSHCCDGRLQYSTLVSRTPMVTRSSCRPAQIRAASNDCRIAKAVPGTSSRSINRRAFGHLRAFHTDVVACWQELPAHTSAREATCQHHHVGTADEAGQVHRTAEGNWRVNCAGTHGRTRCH